MTNFLDEVELSVRAAGVCRRAGWLSYDDFMKVTRADWLASTGGGVRTWREIDGLQQHFRAKEDGKSDLRQAAEHIKLACELLERLDPSGTQLKVSMEGGRPRIWRRIA